MFSYRRLQYEKFKKLAPPYWKLDYTRYKQKRSVFVISAPASRTQIDPSPAPCSLGLPPPSPPYPPSHSTKTKT